jgi:hypothetical protein
MKKLTTLLGFALVGIVLGGCELYLGENKSDPWTYCGEDGLYSCDGDDCQWAGPTCPGGNVPGAQCASNGDCAAGCFCGAQMTCEEAGFCKDNTGCSDGFHCDDRSSCVPDQCNAVTNTGCSPTEGCSGGICKPMSCVLPNEAQCIATNPSGNFKTAQSCEVGQVPLTIGGCYAANAACQVIEQCDFQPACIAIQHEADCLRAVERPAVDVNGDGQFDAEYASCDTTYRGNNCTSPTGQTCTTPGANCTCESFTFSGCVASP